MLLEELKSKIISALGLVNPIFSYPPNSAMGDLSLACFDAAKDQKKNPAEVAAELVGIFTKNEELKKYFSEVKAVGPYLNFFISAGYLARGVIDEIKKSQEKYGRNENGKNRRVMIEYSNGNTHKEYHVGHLRNISYGDAIYHLLNANGYCSIPVSYINDFGINTAKTIWNWRRDPSYAERPEPKGYLLGRCYAKASQALEDNPEGKAEVGRIMQEIESRRGENYKLWEETRQWSVDYFASIYKELNIKFEHIFYESEEIAAGLELVKELLGKGILKKSEGAIIADLEKYDLGVLPVIRSDGTALYPAADLALASEKFAKYHLDESIYVVDVRQSLYFKQLFKILELIGHKQPLVHLTYDFVTLPEGMMSSRSGNVITYQELRDKVLEKLTAETTRRHPDWSAGRVRNTAFNLMIATIKFEMLKVGADRTITFNIDEALKFDGYTACYLQYGYARIRSIIRKQGIFSRLAGNNFLATDLTESKEKILLLQLAKYPEIITAAAAKYNPRELTKYLFELVQLFNDYYHEINILKAKPGVRKARLALVRAVAQVLENGFGILGLKALAEM
jgi:arginyl-tRNA synthetase